MTPALINWTYMINIIASSLPMFSTSSSRKRTPTTGRQFSSWQLESADKTLEQYVLEAQRLTSGQRNLRLCVGQTTIDGRTFNPGDVVVCLFVRVHLNSNENDGLLIFMNFRAPHAKTLKWSLTRRHSSSTGQTVLTSTTVTALTRVLAGRFPTPLWYHLSGSALV